MQLIKKMFGRGPGTGLGPESAQFHESEPTTEKERSASRRELVHVVLRDSMRRHGIPSDWIECRVLPVVTRSKKSGLHVQLIVRAGIDRLLTYVPAFQTSFMEEVARFDARAEDWLLSLSWQFQILPAAAAATLEPQSWQVSGDAPLEESAVPTPPALERSALGSARAGPVVVGTAALAEPAQPAAPSTDDDLLDDLQALYAIRDAVLREGRTDAVGPAGETDFESTQPGGVAPPPTRRPW